MTSMQSHTPTISKPVKEYFIDRLPNDSFLNIADHFRKNEILTDVTLIVDGMRFPAHKFILSIRSDYFVAMFNGTLGCNGNILHLYGITPETFESILKYIYEGAIKIDEDNIFNILDASSLLLLNDLKHHCGKFLKYRLDFENCLQIFSYAKRFLLNELADYSIEYVASVFNDICQTYEFKQMQPENLIDILLMENLSVDSEDKILKSVVAWFDSDVSSRKEDLFDVLKCVRLNYVDETYLKDLIENNNYIKKNEKIKAMFQSAIQNNGPYCSNQSFLWNEPRKLMQFIPSIIAMAGPTLNIYNTELNQWSEIATCKPRHCSAMDVVDSDIYIIGGSLEWRRKASGEKFNTERNEWSQISNMSTARSNFGLIQMQGKLFAIGGYNGSIPLNSCEVYDPKKDQWSMIAPLNKARDGVCCVTDGELIYAIGGYSKSDYLVSTDVYDKETNTWSENVLPPMTTKRQNAMAAYYDGCLFVIGGYMSDNYHSSAEMLDLQTNEWRPMASLPEPRHHAGATAMNGFIFICGGWSSHLPVKFVDMYSIENDVWTRLSSLPTPAMVRCANINFPKKSMLKVWKQNQQKGIENKKCLENRHRVNSFETCSDTSSNNSLSLS